MWTSWRKYQVWLSRVESKWNCVCFFYEICTFNEFSKWYVLKIQYRLSKWAPWKWSIVIPNQHIVDWEVSPDCHVFTQRIYLIVILHWFVRCLNCWTLKCPQPSPDLEKCREFWNFYGCLIIWVDFFKNTFAMF